MNFAVGFDEASPGATLKFHFADIAVLAKDLGPDWYAKTLAGLDGLDPALIERLLDDALQDAQAEVTEILETVPLDHVAARLADALLLRCRGKTVEEIANETAARQQDEPAGPGEQVEVAVIEPEDDPDAWRTETL